MKRFRIFTVTILSNVLIQCSTNQKMQTVSYVDLPKFMGKWYVIANIPTFIEKSAYSPVESYSLEKDGTIATTFTFREGSFSGEEKVYRPKGFVLDPSNAIWEMQFIWPIKAEYLIAYLDANYSKTIIARSARDYVWIMARTPSLTEEEYKQLVKMCGSLGYDISKIVKSFQQ